MPVYHLVPYLFVATTMVGAGAAAVYTALAPKPDPVAQQNQAALPAAPNSAPTANEAPDSFQAPALKEAVKPSFDVVRIESDGNGVIAGRAEPGWKVTIASDDDEIAHAVADRDGEWAVVLDAPLPPGDHAIRLRAHAPEGNHGSVSDQNVAVSIARPQQPARAIVALTQPGSATRLLTPSEPKPQAREKTPAAEPVREQQFQIANAADVAASPEPEPVARAVAANTPAAAAAPEIVVSFDAVDYELNDTGKGKLFLSGQAEAGARVTLYLDNSLVGEAVAAADGTWTFESLRTLPPDQRHTMRADARQSDGQVASRAEVPFTPPAAAKPAGAAASPETPKGEGNEKPQPVAAGPGGDLTESGKNPSATPEAAVTTPEAMTAKRVAGTPAPAIAKAPRQQPANPDAVGAVAPESAALATSRQAEQQATTTRPAPTGLAPEPAPTGSAPETSTPAGVASTPQQDPATRKPEPVALAAAEPTPEPATVKADMARQKRSIVVRRGDTLWHIARRRYGRGVRYTAIYRDNRDQIRNPNLIYPGQEFRLPLR